MAKTPKTPAKLVQLNTILLVARIVIIAIIVVNAVTTTIVYISNTTIVSHNPTISATPATYRGLDEFSDDGSRLAYAATLLDQNLYQSAEAFLSEFLETVEPDSHMATAIRYNLGLAHLYLGEYDLAVSDFSIVLDQTDYPDAYYNLGNALVRLQDYAAALDAYEVAIQLEQKPEYIEGRDAVLALMDETD